MTTTSSSEKRRSANREYMRGYRKRPEVLARQAGQRRWAEPRNRARQAVYMSKPEVQLRKRCARHGLTPEMFYEYLDAQEGACAYCGRELPKNLSKISIDHDHRTGLYRGLVHGQCNTSIGWGEEHLAGYLAAAALAS